MKREISSGRLAASVVAGLFSVVAALLVVITPAASAGPCTPGAWTGADGIVHEGGSCQTDGSGPGPGGPVSGTPAPEYPKTIVMPSCSGDAASGGVQLQVMYYCPQPPCPDPAQKRFARYVQPAAGAVAQFAGTLCRDPNAAPVPVITPQMVTDAAQQIAPKPVAQVQPGTRSYVNIPNNYFTDSAPTTVPVTVLGQQIAVTFEPVGDTWDFGDGSTATGSGIEDAAVGAPGAVEHAYLAAGSYAIHVSRTYTVRFTIPGGPVTVPNAFTIPGADTVLPVGEIQTRVDSAN